MQVNKTADFITKLWIGIGCYLVQFLKSAGLILEKITQNRENLKDYKKHI